MKNKILINVYVISLDEKYEIFISVNESVKKTLALIVKLVVSLSDSEFDPNISHCLIDPDNCSQYAENLIIRDTNIRNAKLILLV